MADRIDVYAQAILDIVQVEGHIDEVEDELFRFARIVEGNDDLRMAISNPGLPLDRRSDIFALGIVLFEMLSGRMPFQDDSPLKLMLDVVQADTPDIRELNPDVD